MIPCPAAGFPAPRGSVVWSQALQWGLCTSPVVQQHLGTPGGWWGRPAELTVRRAAAGYWCDGRSDGGGLCQHVIARGTLHGATPGGAHYCGCCVTAERPQDQFRPGRAAA